MAASRRGSALLVVLTLLGAAARTEAQPNSAQSVHGRPLDVAVHRGATCLDLELLMDELTPLIEDTEVPPGVHVEVIGSDDDPRTATTRVRAPDGALAERVFSPTPSFCPYLHQVLALTLALALKATAEGPAGEPAPQPNAVGDDTAPRAPAPAPEAATRPAAALSLAVGPTLAVGMVGQIAFGAQLELAARFRYASLRGHAHWMRATQAALAGGAGDYQVSFYAGRAEACGRLPFARISLALEACLGGVLGRAHVDQHGVRGHDQTSRTLWGLSPTLAAERDFGGHLSLRFAATLLTVYRPLRIAARNEAGFAVATDDLGRLGGLLSVSLGYHGIIRALRR